MTRIEICNRALRLIGSKPINSINSEEKEATVCREMLEISIKKVLSEHDWISATNYVSLPLNLTAPDFEYTKIFQLPANYIKLVWISTEDYERVGRKIYTNAEKVQIKYIQIPTSTEDLDIWVLETISLYLAYCIALPINGESYAKSETSLLQKYNLQLQQAIIRDNEERTENVDDDEYNWG